MLSYMNKDAATSSVLTEWTGEAVVVRRTVPPVSKLQGTGVPTSGSVTETRIGGIGISAAAMADQNQELGVVVDRGFDVLGIPPRWGPDRC